MPEQPKPARRAARLGKAVPLLWLAATAAPGADGQAAALDVHYREAAARIIQAALADEGGWDKLTHLCKRIGHRLSGSRGLEKAVRWSASEMQKEGLENVQELPVRVPHWVRGKESGAVIAPVSRKLTLAGLGGSVGTAANGLEGEVVVVRSFDELRERGRSRIEGRIVLYNAPFGDAPFSFDGYSQTASYRSDGASRAAALGAAGALVRSLTAASRRTAHTGSLRYDPAQPRIPAAAISLDDADALQSLADQGATIRVRLKMGARTLPDALSANVLGEIRGREKPQEIVVVGCHLDSWDAGQGAHDDGAGCVAAMQSAALLRKLGLRPRRTLRVVLWTNEENGGAGAAAYRRWIGDGILHHVAAIEMDMGAESPIGFGFTLPSAQNNNGTARKTAVAKLQQIGRLVEQIGAGQIATRGGGADLAALTRDGVPGLWPLTGAGRYFEWHHSIEDTLDNVRLEDFRRNLAVMALLGYVLADSEPRFDLGLR